ncbi:MAG TPA: hypothetical protein VF463_19165 [Sphingobium sp.]
MINSKYPRRRLHLPGGLRARDDRAGTPISLEIANDMQIARLPSPDYADLYRVLAKWKLTTVGVEFVTDETERDLRAPDWQFAAPHGFALKDEYRAWSAISYAARRDENTDLHHAATRCSTYLDLLNLRIFQLSAAYNRMLRVWHADGRSQDDDLLISNTFLPHIDAAVHAFLADAGTLRDLASEIVWHLVMKNAAPPVTAFGSFLKTAKGSSVPIAVELITAGADGGWMKALSGLRDRIVHVAPMGADPDHSCRIIMIDVNNDVRLPALHYPLCAPDGSPPPNQRPFTSAPDEQLAALRHYHAFHLLSVDALDYCWATVNRFIDLLSRIRAIGCFRAEVPTITSADILQAD